MTETIEGTALAVAEEPTPHALEIRSAFDISPQQFKAGLKRRGTNRAALMEWIRDALVEGVDWGRLHVVKKEQCDKGKYCDNPYHFSKPSLWKSGAEKISGMMGLRASWPDLDPELERVRAGSKLIVLKCELLGGNGAMVAEGVGARSLDADYMDVNKALKMAKKSGLIDAVLNAGGLSEVFTQDVEDMDPSKFPDAAVADPYQKDQDRADTEMPGSVKSLETHCPIGREWKGTPWEEVEDGFLRWVLSNIDDKPKLTERVKRELGSRSVESQAATKRREDKTWVDTAKAPKIADWAREISLATSLDRIIEIRDTMPEDYKPGLGTFLAQRESEFLTRG